MEPCKLREASGVQIFLPSAVEGKVGKIVTGIVEREVLGRRRFFGSFFIGPPGTGKTLCVEHIAERTGSLFAEAPYLAQPAEVVELFEFLRARAKEAGKPVCVRVNDTDYMGKRSEGMMNGVEKATFKQMLAELENPDNDGVFTFMNSNEPSIMDNALRRPPRILYEVEFLPPKLPEREKILKAILAHFKPEVKWSEEMVKFAADITFGYTGGDLSGIVQAACINARVRKDKVVNRDDVLSAKKDIRPSAIRDMPFIEPRVRLDDLLGSYVRVQKMMLADFAARIDSGSIVILYGPSGCGKTSLPKAIGAQFGFNTLLLDSSHIINKWVGEPGRKLAQYFDRAAALAPSVLILDQAEGIIHLNSDFSQEWLAVLKSRTSDPIPGVMVCMTCINPSGFGQEILGRSTKAYIGAPDQLALFHVARKLLPEGSKVDLKAVFSKERHLSMRDMINALRDIVAMGGELTTEVVSSVLDAIPANTQDETFKEMVGHVGDATAMYRAIKGIEV